MVVVMTLSKTTWIAIGAIMLIAFASQLRDVDLSTFAVIWSAFVVAFDWW